MRSAIVALALLAPVTTGLVMAQDAAPVRVDEVISEPMRQTAPVLGRIVARQRGDIAAQVAGPVEAVNVDVGDRVAKGDPIALIDDSWLVLTLRLREAELAEARSDAAREEASLTMARQSLDRVAGLTGTSSYSGARFEDAEGELSRAAAALAAARSRVARAEADLGVARLSVERARIAAPYSGVVVARYAQPGTYLDVGSPVVSLIQDSSMEIEADVPVEQSMRLEPGATLSARRAVGEEIAATVRAVIPEENPLTRTRAVRFTAGSTDARLTAGESVTLDIPLGGGELITTVHKDAVVQQPDGATVFVVADGEAQMRPIVIGLAVGDRFEVTEGLEPGDVVVIRGNERLRPGQKVSF
jgi:RND family efflux transporter MFP subunit